MSKETILVLNKKIEKSYKEDKQRYDEEYNSSHISRDNDNWRNRWKGEIFLLKNNINYENYDGSQNALLIDKFIFYPATNKWQVKGKNVYYKSKGIEDFLRRFYNRW